MHHQEEGLLEGVDDFTGDLEHDAEQLCEALWQRDREIHAAADAFRVSGGHVDDGLKCLGTDFFGMNQLYLARKSVYLAYNIESRHKDAAQ